MRNLLHVTILSATLGLSANAAIIFSLEAAGVQSTTRTGVLVENFDSLSAGALGAYTSPIGEYSTGGQIVSPNAFGGSGQSLYIAVGAQSKTTAYTLDFGTDLTYFGFYWAAGDAKNKVEFYDNGILQGSFTTASWATGLPAAYSGNPNTGQNKGEKYAFLNFDGTNGAKFDMVKFLNNGTGTGFETDNHTILASETPEPATWAMMATAIGAFAFARRRKLV